MNRMFIVTILLLIHPISYAQSNIKPAVDTTLLFPAMVKSEQVFAGNPFAQYISLKQMELKYINSMFEDIYMQQVKNFEQFLGFPYAGVEAMQLKMLKQNYGDSIESPGHQYKLIRAIDIIKEQAKTHRIIIWGEEHHLPQTRALYAAMIKELWNLGFRYLAAESFTSEIESKTLKYVNYRSGFYTRDPVYADAVNMAIKLGFTLIAYDNNEKERDKVQAENIKKKVFDNDPNAKVLIFAGRSHCVEEKTADGWEPMGYCLKKITGLDPFTIYAPTMSERLTAGEEHPVYKYVAANMGLNQISILQDSTMNNLFGNGIYADAYAFFPRVKLINGRPDWLFSVLNRKSVPIPEFILKKDEELLVQVFAEDQSVTDVPVDQVVVNGKKIKTRLTLPAGKYWCRAVYANDSESKRTILIVK